MLKKIAQSPLPLLILLVLALLVRLHGFGNPIADWHSWRQADTSAVSRNFVKHGFDLLHPRFDDLSNVPSGKDNPHGYRFVEFPLYNVTQAGLFTLFHGFTLEQWGRLTTIFASLLSTLFIYLLVARHASRLAGFFAAFFFAFLPYNIYYGRVILPDPAMVSATLGGIYFFDLWIGDRSKKPDSAKATKDKQEVRSKHWIFFVLSLLFTAEALLFKPYALFFLLPMVYLAYKGFGLSMVKKWQLWLFLILAVLPLALWRIWMMQYPEGIPVNAWLFNGGDIRFKGAYFYWLFADRIGRLILGYWGIALFSLGILTTKYKKEGLFFLSFLVSSLLYLVVIARGNVQHDYYQILTIPSLAIFLGLGSAFLIYPMKELVSRFTSIPLLLICTIFSLMFGWYFVRDYFNINNPSIIVAGKAVDKLTPKDAKVLALYDGDTSFLYQTNRQGWTSFEKPLPEMIRMGADYMVIANPQEQDYHFGKEYKVISSTPQYVLFDLKQKP